MASFGDMNPNLRAGAGTGTPPSPRFPRSPFARSPQSPSVRLGPIVNDPIGVPQPRSGPVPMPILGPPPAPRLDYGYNPGDIGYAGRQPAVPPVFLPKRTVVPPSGRIGPMIPTPPVPRVPTFARRFGDGGSSVPHLYPAQSPMNLHDLLMALLPTLYQ